MRFRMKIPVLVVLASAAAAVTAAQAPVDGSLDVGFDGDGAAVVAFDAGSDLADHGRAVIPLADGRILVAGTVAIPGPGQAAGIARLMPDGSLDPSFGAGGRVVVPSDSLTVSDATAGPSGQIYLTVTLGTGAPCVLRLTADGNTDLGFGTGGFACFGSGSVGITTLLDPNGTEVLVVREEGFAGVSFVRFDTDGVLVDYGDFGLGVDELIVNQATMDLNRNLLVVGQIMYPGTWGREIMVLGFHPDYTLNSGFGTGGARFIPVDLGGSGDDIGLAIVVAPNGDFLVGGSADSDAGVDAVVLQLGPTGQNLSLFNFGFYSDGANNDAVEALSVQPNGRLLAAGTVEFDGTTDVDFGVARLLIPDTGGSWSLDPTFINGGRRWIGFDLGGADVDRGHDIALGSQGILIAGEAEESGADVEFAVTRLTVGLLFADGFESGDGSAWSAPSP